MMKIRVLFIFFIIFASSCQFFETEKISSEQFFKEEMKVIDWNEIDQYPAFPECREITEKQAQKSCFVNAISKKIHDMIQKEDLYSTHSLDDTILIELSISNEGIIQVIEIDIDSIVENQIPSLREIIPGSIDSLVLESPAYKRGIPVETRFILPVYLKTD